MSAEHLAKGLEALEDDATRAKVGDGDLSAFAGLELTDEELGLLEAAISEYLEVVGFDIRLGLLNLSTGLEEQAPSGLDRASTTQYEQIILQHEGTRRTK